MTFDPEVGYRALCARDSRFDGVFFVAVKTTGVYCRPICPARTPLKHHCELFATWAQAERAGYRACLRCRPELAPGHANVDALSKLCDRAVARIARGALAERSLTDLAAELGVSARHLRRALVSEIGLSPHALERSRRLLLAKQLLQDSSLPITQIAFASGFRSLRRFNAEFRAHSGHAPSALRSAARKGKPRRPRETAFDLRLDYRPPLAWDALLEFLSARAIAGVEQVTTSAYCRSVRIGGARGIVRVQRGAREGRLHAEVSCSLVSVLPELVQRLRRLFDLDAEPRAIDVLLSCDPQLAGSVERTPGLRVPGAFEGFELLWRAILGQQVSVAAATTLAGRFAHAFGEPLAEELLAFGGPTRFTPEPARVAQATIGEIAALGVTGARATALQAAAKAVASGAIELAPQRGPAASDRVIHGLLALPGVGPWTASYVAMRALGQPDVLLEGDLALCRALGLRGAALRERAEAWRPFRAYGVLRAWGASTEAAQRPKTRQRAKVTPSQPEARP